MILNKDKWDLNDKAEFIKYLEGFKSTKDLDRSRRILNTSMPLLGLNSKMLNDVTKEIFKGNYESFLALKIDDYYETTAIYGNILTKIKDFDQMETYLEPYMDMMENWAHCDILTFRITDKNIDKFLTLSLKYEHDDRPFVRRFSLYILLLITRNQNINELVFKRVSGLNQNSQYYVMMMAAWLLCETIIKHKDDAFLWLDKVDIAPNIMNKAISKCRDSYRLTDADKQYLLKYKK